MEDRESESRVWTRFLIKGGKVRLNVSPEEILDAVITDDSYGGVGIVLEVAEPRLSPGLRVQVLVPDGGLSSVVRYVVPHGNVWRVGLEWETPGPFRAGHHWIGESK